MCLLNIGFCFSKKKKNRFYSQTIKNNPIDNRIDERFERDPSIDVKFYEKAEYRQVNKIEKWCLCLFRKTSRKNRQKKIVVFCGTNVVPKKSSFVLRGPRHINRKNNRLSP